MAEPTPSPAPSDVVNLIDENGNLVGVPKAQSQQAVQKYGFKTPTPQQLQEATDKQTYGEGTSNELKAGALGAAGTFSFGAIPAALAATGVVPPEEQAGLAKYNPTATMVGQGVGLGAGIGAAALTGGLSEAAPSLGLADLLNPIGAVSKLGKVAEISSNPLAKGLAGAVASPETSPILNAALNRGTQAGIGSAVEAAFYGVGNSLDEYAVGDPKSLGEHLAPNVVNAMLLGGAFGAGLGVIGGGAGATKNKFFPEAEKAAVLDEARQQTVQSGVPGTYDEIRQRVKNASYQGTQLGELPAKQTLIDANAIAPMKEFPVLNIQLEALSDQRANDHLKAFLETPLQEAKDFRDYQSGQKREALHNLSSEVKNIAPTETLTNDPVRGGESLVKAFTDHYQEEKEALAPLFKKFDETGKNPIQSFGTIVDPIEKSVPGASKYLKATEEGLEIAPYSPKMPFSKNTYEAVKDLITAANDKDLTMGELRNVRESMRDRINWLSSPRDSAQISSLRSSLMDFMERGVQEIEPDLAVRDTFKRYAQNEERRSIIEKIFGGSISDKATFSKEIKTEDVLDKLFANSVTVKAAKEILPANTFNKAVGDYLSYRMSKVTDNAKNGFYSNQFSKLLASKTPELNVALAESPETLQRMHAYTDIMRILPDSPPINPPQTAKTLHLLDMIKKAGSLLSPMSAGKEMIGEGLKSFAARAETQRLADINAHILAGKTAAEAEKAIEERAQKYSVLKQIESAYQNSQRAVQSGVKQALSGSETLAAPAGAYLAEKISNKKEDHKKILTAINDIHGNPDKFLDKLDQSTQGLYAVAPEATAEVHQSLIRAVQFLKSKIPVEPPHLPFSREVHPSPAEISKFQKYYDTVKRPIDTLKDLNHGVLTSESIETLNAVYPTLYGQMKEEMIDQLSSHLSKEKDLHYTKKIALSRFLGQPLDDSMTPQFILSTQMAIAQKQQKKEAEQAQQGAPSKPGMGKISSASQAMTALQQSSNRNQS